MNHSEQINEIAAALSKAQAMLKPVKREQINPFFKSKYADLSSVIEGAKDALSQNNLAVTQLISNETSPTVVNTLITILTHSSGQWFRSAVAIPLTKNDAQALGAAITYLRRYAFCAIVGVATEDDDGHEASQPAGVQALHAKPPTHVAPQVKVPTTQVTGQHTFDNKNAEHQRLASQILVKDRGFKGDVVALLKDLDGKVKMSDFRTVNLQIEGNK